MSEEEEEEERAKEFNHHSPPRRWRDRLRKRNRTLPQQALMIRFCALRCRPPSMLYVAVDRAVPCQPCCVPRACLRISSNARASATLVNGTGK